nr:hypothetical protein B1D4.150 [imported] - Neurospora crassa [Neurospora crassa]
MCMVWSARVRYKPRRSKNTQACQGGQREKMAEEVPTSRAHRVWQPPHNVGGVIAGIRRVHAGIIMSGFGGVDEIQARISARVGGGRIGTVFVARLGGRTHSEGLRVDSNAGGR